MVMLTRRDVALGLLLASVSRRLAAQPALTQHTGPTIETEGSIHYGFEHFRLDSADRQRHYRIVIGTPRRKPPARAHPALYLLDGNAALMAIDDALLAQVVQADCPPVLAFVCYDNDLRIDATARAYDYTPARRDDGAEEWDIPGRRRSGGAAAFLARYAMPDGADKQLAASLATVAGLSVSLQELTGLNHGQTLGASLPKRCGILPGIKASIATSTSMMRHCCRRGPQEVRTLPRRAPFDTEPELLNQVLQMLVPGTSHASGTQSDMQIEGWQTLPRQGTAVPSVS